MKEKIKKYLGYIIGFVLFWVVGLNVVLVSYKMKEREFEFIDNVAYECSEALYNNEKYSNKPNSIAIAYLNRIGIKVDNDVYIKIVNKCVEKYKRLK